VAIRKLPDISRRLIMHTAKTLSIGFAALFLTAVLCTDGHTRERHQSGAYKGRNTSGTFQRDVSKSNGNATRDTKWQNERGEGQRHSERHWNKESGTGTYSSSTKRADGKTSSSEGTIKKNADGSYSQHGTVTGPKGNTSTVDRDVTKNADGSRSVHSTYTNQDNQTLTVDKTVQKTDAGRTASGTYSSSTGKSGTFESQSTAADGKITTHRSLTNQDQKTWQRDIETSRDGNALNRNVTTTNPEGKKDSFSQSVTLDPKQ
jgi:hypothetical protein